MDPREQLERIKLGAAEIISEEDLLAKFERSQRTGKPLKVKLGLDPSAPDIHIGHTVVLHKMRQFQDLGHQGIIVIGDFTGRIGDPTGRSETRRQLSEEEIRENAVTYQRQVFKILDPERTTITFNSTWLAPLTFEGVVKLASKVTVARMLERDDFANRYREGRPIFIHEFFYPLMQAYDSVALDADVELGGTDQKFNNLMGRALQREFGQESQCVVLTPILPGLDGVQKMSKSLGNYIGINEPPGEIFGKTMSIPDDLIVPYINCATRLPHQEKVAIERGLASGQLHPMAAKKRLAWQFVAEYHGEEQADAAQVEFERVFSRRQVPDDVPLLTVPASELSDGRIGIVRLMMLGALASSNSEARRLVDQGGVRIDDVKVESSNDLVEVRSGMILKVGKRRFAKVAVE
ncbi:MAG: tyrosine--tRNA ligase [Bacillota bacterium]|jgi:tyrosyl-tRNA synthetase|nr:tyrosine--tRNA ligase [Bacillota bacterium]